MDNKILKKLQNTEQEILNEIVRICNKHKIKYFMFFGTLLGSIRHKGFIPWDDDIDIAMTREEYNKFLSVAQKELKDKFELECKEYDKNCYIPYAKVRNKKTAFLEFNAKNSGMEKGIWVDIFPLDYEDNINIIVKIKKYITAVIIKLLAYKNLKIETKNIFKILSVKLTSIFSNKFFFSIIKFLTKGKKDGKYLVMYCDCDVISKLYYEKEFIFPLKKSEFNDKKYNIPENPDKILTRIYGDYMKLPPIEKRITHNPLLIKFEDGEVYDFR